MKLSHLVYFSSLTFAAIYGAETAKRAVENNFLSDASRKRLNALKAKYHCGEKLTNKEELEFIDLIQSDMRSDGLLDKFRKDPNSLTNKEREQFASYIERYYIETVTGNTASGHKLASATSSQDAQNRFESEYLINDPVPKRDYGHFPFAGTNAQRSQAVDTLPEESKNWLGWRSETYSPDEKMYYDINNKYEAIENYKNSSNGQMAYAVKDGLEWGSLLALGGGGALVRGVALVEDAAATVGGKALVLADKGEKALLAGKEAATKAYINGQLVYVDSIDKGIKAYGKASAAAQNAYINGQLAYVDAVGRGMNMAKVSVREGIDGTKELVSQGIYYSYRPGEFLVDTGRALTSMPKEYKIALGTELGTTFTSEFMYYQNGLKDLSNSNDLLGTGNKFLIDPAYGFLVHKLHPVAGLAADITKGIIIDNKEYEKSPIDSARSGNVNMITDYYGNKLGINNNVVKVISTGLNKTFDYLNDKKEHEQKKLKEGNK